MAMMQGSNKPKNIGKPTGGPPLEAMTAENLAPPTGMEGREEDLAKGMQSLVKTMKIKISGFGTFSTKRTLERVGRNPKSKESYIIPSFKKLTFNASAKVKGVLN